MALLRFLVIVLTAYLILRLIGRYVLPWLGKKAIEKARKKMNERMERQRSGEKVYESGEMTIRKSSGKDKRENNNDEEFVDYEEVE